MRPHHDRARAKAPLTAVPGPLNEPAWQDERERRGVDLDRIKSRAYRSLVRSALSAAAEVAYRDIVRMLGHRSGTPYEDLYAYGLVSGCRLGSIVNAHRPKRVELSQELCEAIAEATREDRVALVHSHPDSLPPSAADIQSLAATGAKRGVIACHDGSLYVFEIRGAPVPGYTISDETIRMLQQLRDKDESDVLRGYEESLGVHVEHLR